MMDWMKNDVLHTQLLQYGAGRHDDGPDCLSRVFQVMHTPKVAEIADETGNENVIEMLMKKDFRVLSNKDNLSMNGYLNRVFGSN